MQSNHLKPASDQLSPESLFDYQRFEHHALFEGIAYVWDALKRLADYIEQYLKNPHQRNDVTIMPGAVVEPNVVFGADVTVEPHVYIKGPAIIGDRTEIRHGAYIRENVIVGRDCIIGNTTEVKHSIIMDGARASHWNYIGDSIVGFGVNLGAGVKLSNKKITNTEIKIRDTDGNAYATGLLKLGAIIGDETQIGCNAVLNPGTLLGKRCLVYPLVSAFGTYSHGKVIK
jgi:UDP-N-acetylglucosamine diphosphorylase / glucose-1-phosphate thymidylyltransferase / UDP-N-acetylgalactosamine diphosphorylase / glucosamine-1-phosphate N-acetyltransferase / galactosamine-1-phosphate N-acetyltransferase